MSAVQLAQLHQRQQQQIQQLRLQQLQMDATQKQQAMQQQVRFCFNQPILKIMFIVYKYILFIRLSLINQLLE